MQKEFSQEQINEMLRERSAEKTREREKATTRFNEDEEIGRDNLIEELLDRVIELEDRVTALEGNTVVTSELMSPGMQI